jgi:hypothetical protein
MTKKSLFLVFLLFSISQIHSRTNQNIQTDSVQNDEIYYIENQGQVHDQFNNLRNDVLFTASANDLIMHIKNNGVSYQIQQVNQKENQLTNFDQRKESSLSIYRVDITWINSNPTVKFEPNNTPSNYTNFFNETHKNGLIGVKSYNEITLKNLYKGIDVHYYQQKGSIKHDYIVQPNTDYHQIQFKIEGAEIKISNDGSLILETPFGKIEEGAPIVFQEGKILQSNWVINNNIISFNVEGYNPNYELIIDPITRLWGTYFGAGASEAMSTKYDSDGNVYITGLTQFGAGTTIATTGAYQTTFGNGFYDAYIAKFNTFGFRLWSTYYGGTGTEYSNSCAVDDFGNVYIAGSTTVTSTLVIASDSSHQEIYGGGSDDGFIAKFNTNGIRIWSSLYGGSGSDVIKSCALDAFGNIFFVGTTTSLNNISDSSVHQFNYGGGPYDAFLVKFDTSGTRIWSTYYGGNKDDQGSSCSVDSDGNVILVGTTNSQNGTTIATTGSYQPQMILGVFNYSFDAFICKFTNSGFRVWATYFGGLAGERGLHSCVDNNKNIIMCGDTGSLEYISTPGAFQTSHSGNFDAYLVKFDENGVRLWGTYFGGVEHDRGMTCTVDAINQIYLSGQTRTSTPNIISTLNSHQVNYGGGDSDIYLVKFDANGQRLWGTYYGGLLDDYCNSCCIDDWGNIYLAGNSNSNNGISTSSAYQTSCLGLFNSILAKFRLCSIGLTPLSQTNVSSIGGNDGIVSLQPATGGLGNYTYNWSPGNPTGDGTTSISNLTAGTWSCLVTDSIGCFAQYSFIITEPILLQFSDSTFSNVSCHGFSDGSATVTNAFGGAGGYSYDWTPGNPLGDGTTSISGLTSGTWMCTVTDQNGDQVQQSFVITEPDELYLSASIQSTISCNSANDGIVTIDSLSGGSGTYIFDWLPGNPIGDGTGTISNLSAGTWICSVTDNNGCTLSDSITLMEPNELYLSVSIQSTISCSSANDGVVTLDSLSGGNGVYTIDWLPGNPIGDGTNTISNLSSGNWICSVIDTNGCSLTDTIHLAEPANILGSQTFHLCAGESLLVGSNNYTSSGTYSDVFTASNGCDSTLTTFLTIENPIDISINSSGFTIAAILSGANYQWIDCSNNSPLSGENNQSFTASNDGSYAVVITINSCSDTSICTVLNSSNLNEFSDIEIKIFPNPVTDILTVTLSFNTATLQISDVHGKVIESRIIDQTEFINFEKYTDGVYFFTFITSNGSVIYKVIKN